MCKRNFREHVDHDKRKEHCPSSYHHCSVLALKDKLELLKADKEDVSFPVFAPLDLHVKVFGAQWRVFMHQKKKARRVRGWMRRVGMTQRKWVCQRRGMLQCHEQSAWQAEKRSDTPVHTARQHVQCKPHQTKACNALSCPFS